MKKRIFALLAAGALILCACTAKEKDVEKNVENDTPNVDASQDVQAAGGVDMKQLVNGKVSVINTKTGEKVKLNSYSEDRTEVARYAIVDLDGDGKDEYLAEYAGSGDTLIIRNYENELYGYMIPFSSRFDLKTDGEMMWSDGASHSGICRVVFSDKDIEFITSLDSDFDSDIHYIDGQEATFDEAMKEWNKFDAKENTDWFDAYFLLD